VAVNYRGVGSNPTLRAFVPVAQLDSSNCLLSSRLKVQILSGILKIIIKGK
jgi:hypothetical protein